MSIFNFDNYLMKLKSNFIELKILKTVIQYESILWDI